jgi:hypothetical protein
MRPARDCRSRQGESNERNEYKDETLFRHPIAHRQVVAQLLKRQRQTLPPE